MLFLKQDTRFFPGPPRAVGMITDFLAIDADIPLEARMKIVGRFEGYEHIRSPEATSLRGDVVLFDHSVPLISIKNIRVGDADGNFIIKDWVGDSYGTDFVLSLSGYQPLQGKMFSVWRKRDVGLAELLEAEPPADKKHKTRIFPMNPYHSKRIPL